MSLNKVLLIGNVGKDPEIRYLDGNGQNTGSNNKVATFTLATTERFRDRNGNTQERTEWHNIVAWRFSADIVEKFVRKGTQLFIEGKLRTRDWTDQNGIKHYTTEINVDNLQLLGKRSDNPASQNQGYAQPAQAPVRVAPAQPQQTPVQPQQNPVQSQPSPAPAQQQAPASPESTQDLPSDDLPF